MAFKQVIIQRVGPLFWLLGGFSKKQNMIGFSRFFAAVSIWLFCRQLAAFAMSHS